MSYSELPCFLTYDSDNQDGEPIPPKEILDLLQELSDWTEVAHTYSYEDEYLTLWIGSKLITQGEPEVIARLKQLKREHGIF